MKKQSNISRLMGYAGKHRYFTYASWLLAVISALIALLPFVYIWKIIKEVLDVAPNFSSATGLVHNGIMAMIFAIVSFLVYISALMCSHLAAFRVAMNMRVAVTEHIAKLPLGFADSFGSGKLRKIINDSTGATETYIKGVVRGREVKIDLAPPNKDTDMGGYTVLDIVFGDADRADLIIEPFEITDDKTKQVIRGNRYFVRTVDEDGRVYECPVKPSRTSDRSMLQMLLAE